MREVDVSIIVVTYKENLNVLKECFDSVARSCGTNYELIISDNGSSDLTRGLLSSYDHALYLRNKTNIGFSAAVNRGISIARGRYMLLLNPDTRFGIDVLSKMIAHLDNDKEVGIASCLIKNMDGTIQESIRRFPMLKDQLLIMCKAPHFAPNLPALNKYMMRDSDPHKTQDVDSIMGAFMFIRRELIEKIGYLDERYFIWYEEVDYCMAASKAGWKVRHYGDVEVSHHKGHMFNQLSTWRKQKWVRQSMRFYMRKNVGIISWAVLWMLTPVFLFLGGMASIIKRH